MLPTALLAGGALTLWLGILGFQELGERRLWPKVSATILEDQLPLSVSESDTGTPRHEIRRLRLRFVVGGREYDEVLKATPADLQLQKLKGVAGEKFTVAYNPLKPQELHTQADQQPGWCVMLGTLFLIVGFAFIVAGIQRREIAGNR